MGFWNLFKNKESATIEVLQNEQEQAVDMQPDNLVKKTSNDDGNALIIRYGTGMPIDLIYKFLKEDYETKGYEDAMSNPDMSYKGMNMQMIKSTLEVKFRQVRLRYTDNLRTIQFHISSRSNAGLVDVVKLLETQKETLMQHMDELTKMEQDFKAGLPYMNGMLLSYERGFLRGLAALSLGQIFL
ncbi:hypothetical protein [Bacteroides acidifaciens]|uniref:hypothetical protein n=1 Tax=Bacteroides acidifaciens TaxID=85831 RepID=UPI00158D8599|nr:hypothetical protein [Bacteroides acidifaciens]